MSRLDDIERRLTALESGGNMTARLAALEEQLGMSTASTGSSAQGTQQCGRCGMLQAPGFKCSQAKCPLQ